MKDWKSVPIPQLMLDHCERDPRGMPVPFVVLKDQEGKHHFKINDSEKSLKCVIDNLCTICGQPLSKDNRWLVGGIASAFDEKGYYIDLCVHKECGQYALQVCPYLAVRHYNGKVDMDKLKEKIPGYRLENLTVDQDRLPMFVLGRSAGIRFMMSNSGLVVVPKRPFLETEFWCDGEIIPHLAEVLLKIQDTKWEKYEKDIKRLPGWSVQIA